MDSKRKAREWLIHGGGGHEDGEDGLRALSVSGEGLIEFLAAYEDYVLRSLKPCHLLNRLEEIENEAP